MSSLAALPSPGNILLVDIREEEKEDPVSFLLDRSSGGRSWESRAAHPLVQGLNDLLDHWPRIMLLFHKAEQRRGSGGGCRK